MDKKQLHTLIESINDEDLNIVYQLLLRFANYDFPCDDEVAAFQNAMLDLKNNNTFTHDEVWEL